MSLMILRPNSKKIIKIIKSLDLFSSKQYMMGSMKLFNIKDQVDHKGNNYHGIITQQLDLKEHINQ